MMKTSNDSYYSSSNKKKDEMLTLLPNHGKYAMLALSRKLTKNSNEYVDLFFKRSSLSMSCK